jgi:hypothetical protein
MGTMLLHAAWRATDVLLVIDPGAGDPSLQRWIAARSSAGNATGILFRAAAVPAASTWMAEFESAAHGVTAAGFSSRSVRRLRAGMIRTLGGCFFGLSFGLRVITIMLLPPGAERLARAFTEGQFYS